MSLCLGLRAKEMAALSLNDVFNPDHSLREVLHLKCAYSKGAKARDVFVSSPPLIRQLTEYRHAIGDRDPASPMFPSRKGGYLRPGSMARFLTLILREAGMEHASSHSGRRTLITRLAERGVDLKAIAVIAGHSNIRTTAIYVESSPVRLSRILQEVTW
jgi:integrase/recombinase XerD